MRLALIDLCRAACAVQRPGPGRPAVPRARAGGAKREPAPWRDGYGPPANRSGQLAAPRRRRGLDPIEAGSATIRRFSYGILIS